MKKIVALVLAALMVLCMTSAFAATGLGHGTDRALIAGILGMKPDHEDLPRSLEIAKEKGFLYSIRTVRLPKCHPNTAVIRLWAEDGDVAEVEGASVGGGNILITRLNGLESAFTGQYNTLIIPHKDTYGVIAGVAQALAAFRINIGNFRLTRQEKGHQAIMTLEVDGDVSRELLMLLRALPNVLHVVYLHANE